MAIQLKQISGDTVELVFDPREDDLHLGENLSVAEDQGRRGLIVQIIEFRMISLPCLLPERSPLAKAGLASELPAALRSGEPLLRLNDASPLQLAIAKIRRRTGPTWHHWDGWIPRSDAVVAKIADREVLRHCIPQAGNPLRLGKTRAGEDFYVEGRTLEKINLITGVKGSGPSHLAAIILRELIACGAPCVIFDLNREYTRFARDDIPAVEGRKTYHHLAHLVAGDTMKLGVAPFGLGSLQTLLTDFGLPEAAAMYFVSHVAHSLATLKQQGDLDQSRPSLGIDDLIKMAHDLEPVDGEIVSRTLLSCLKAIRETGVLATFASEAIPFRQRYEEIRDGGAVAIDLSGLTHRARPSFVHAVIEILQEICDSERAQGSNRFPFVFFDQAHLYINRHTVGDIVIRAKHRGVTSFLMTDMVAQLDDAVLRQANNLFILRLPYADDIRRLSETGFIDQETMTCVVPRLPDHHSLLLGDATRAYPIIFTFGVVDGSDAADEIPYFFRSQAADAPSIRPADAPGQHETPPPAAASDSDATLPLFPEGIPARITPRPSAAHGQAFNIPQPSPPVTSFAQVTTKWEQIVKRLGRRRRILETILSMARPLRIDGHTLVLGFPPQHRFQQELIESADYRTLLEEELASMFGVTFDVTTVLEPTQEPPRRRG
jgi:uncharacterized protein